MQNNCNREEFSYAGFWVRLSAYIIDSIIVFAGLLIVRLIMAGIMKAASGTVLEGNILFQYTLKDIVLYIAQVLYFILCTYYTGTTVGKRMLNLRVISSDETGRLSFFSVVYRETVGRFLSAAILCIGYIMIGIDDEKRGLHDMMADTRVVYGKKIKVYPVYRGMPPQQMPSQQMPPQQMPPQQMPPQQPVEQETPAQPAMGYHMVKPEHTGQQTDEKEKEDK